METLKENMATHRKRREIESEAARILRQHGLYSIPVDPVALANRSGIKVYNAKFSDDNLSGMIAKRGDSVNVLVNQNDYPKRKRFTIAHELGHHFLHLLSIDEGEFVDSEDEVKVDLFRDTESMTDPEFAAKYIEVEANQFAAALLMPEEFIRQVYAETEDIEVMADFFEVSRLALENRLKQLGLRK